MQVWTVNTAWITRLFYWHGKMVGQLWKIKPIKNSKSSENTFIKNVYNSTFKMEFYCSLQVIMKKRSARQLYLKFRRNTSKKEVVSLAI